MEYPVHADGRKSGGTHDAKRYVHTLIARLDGVSYLLVEGGKRRRAENHLVRAMHRVTRQERRGNRRGGWLEHEGNRLAVKVDRVELHRSPCLYVCIPLQERLELWGRKANRVINRL